MQQFLLTLRDLRIESLLSDTNTRLGVLKNSPFWKIKMNSLMWMTTNKKRALLVVLFVVKFYGRQSAACRRILMRKNLSVEQKLGYATSSNSLFLLRMTLFVVFPIPSWAREVVVMHVLRASKWKVLFQSKNFMTTNHRLQMLHVNFFGLQGYRLDPLKWISNNLLNRIYWNGSYHLKLNRLIIMILRFK